MAWEREGRTVIVRTSSGKIFQCDATDGQVNLRFDSHGAPDDSFLTGTDRYELENSLADARQDYIHNETVRLQDHPDWTDVREELIFRDDAEELNQNPEKFLRAFHETLPEVRPQRGSTAQERSDRKRWEREVENLKKTIASKNEKGWGTAEEMAELIQLQENEPPPIQKGEGFDWQEDPEDEKDTAGNGEGTEVRCSLPPRSCRSSTYQMRGAKWGTASRLRRVPK